MKKRIYPIAVVLAVLVLASCQSQSAGSIAAQPAGSNTVVVTQEQDGSQVVLTPGQTLLVRLPVSNDRGMTWQMETMPNQAVIMPDGEQTVRSNEQIKYGSLISYVELRFQAQAAGETTLQLNYDRSGQGEGSVERRFNLDVVVSASRGRSSR